MEQKMEKLNRYFEEKIAGCEQRDRELSADGRGDEAVFEKVRGNIYDAMRTWLAVAARINPGNADGAKDFFIQRVEQIPASWAAAYDKAKEHGDTVWMQTEQVKLDVVREVRAKFDEIWEGGE